MADDKTLRLEIATPNGRVLDTHVQSVEAPSVAGEFGVLPGHLPILAALKCGVLTYAIDGKQHFAAIGPGFVKGGPSHVEVLTDLFLDPANINAENARRDLDTAQEAFKAFGERHEGPAYAGSTRHRLGRRATKRRRGRRRDLSNRRSSKSNPIRQADRAS
ncbi:MAG: ATP synthase F1 subunit epsilon [Polyangiales bacterium]